MEFPKEENSQLEIQKEDYPIKTPLVFKIKREKEIQTLKKVIKNKKSFLNKKCDESLYGKIFIGSNFLSQKKNDIM